MGDVCHAVFVGSNSQSPEFFTRNGNSVIYIAGVNPVVSLPKVATGSTTDPEAVKELQQIARKFIKSSSDLRFLRTAVCFRPTTKTGLPILARIKDEDLGIGISTRPGAEGGVFLATGHGPWGISLSLGTGKVMAEMMQGRELSASIEEIASYS